MYNKLGDCLGNLCLSTEDETQWKHLNYQVLLYVRHNSPKVRLRVISIISCFLDKKGENYLAVLPDSAPLLAEALEDDDAKVEKECRKLIKKMEEIFGHSVESYFE
jgi:U3 small nucleolar RNA-associated protein 10